MNVEAPSVIAIAQEKSPSLYGDFSWMFVGNAIYAGGQFATLMLLAKLIRPEMVGQYALGLALVYPVMLLTNMQLRAVLISNTSQQVRFGHYLGLRLLTTSLGLAIVFAITQILSYGRNLTAVVLMVGVAYGVETISDMYYARLQLHDRMAEISKSLIARSLLSVLCLVLATYVSRNVLWGIAGVALARAVILVGYDMCERTQGLAAHSKWFSRSEPLSPRFDFAVQRKVLWISLPLGVVMLLGCLNSSIPNFFIKNALGDGAVGIFATIGFVVSIGNMAVVSLGQSAFTRLARSYAAGNLGVFGSLLGKLLALGAAIGVCGMLVSKLAGREILTMLFRPEYAQHADLLSWIMVAGGVSFMAQFLGFGITAANLYRPQIGLNIAANLSLFLACYWLVHQSGLLGAIFAMIIAAIVQLVGSVAVLLKGVQMQARARAGGAEPA